MNVLRFADLTAGFISVGIKLYFYIFLFSLLLTWVNADKNSTLTRFINGLTHPLFRRVKKILHPLWHPYAAFISCLLILYAGEFLPPVIRNFGKVVTDQLSFDSYLIVVALYAIIAGMVLCISVAIFIACLAGIWFMLSLANVSLHNPLVRMIFLLINPLITPLQKWLPRSKVDWSPFILIGILFIGYQSLTWGIEFLYRHIFTFTVFI